MLKAALVTISMKMHKIQPKQQTNSVGYFMNVATLWLSIRKRSQMKANLKINWQAFRHKFYVAFPCICMCVFAPCKIYILWKRCKCRKSKRKSKPSMRIEKINRRLGPKLGATFSNIFVGVHNRQVQYLVGFEKTDPKLNFCISNAGLGKYFDNYIPYYI